MNPLFGPGGNSLDFYAAGHKATVEAPAFVKAYGLDAYEYEAGNGLRTSDATLSAIGKAAVENSVHMSLHAPYFISLSSVERAKREAAVGYVKQSLHAARLLCAKTIVIHCGGVAKITREEGMALSKETLGMILSEIPDTFGISLGLETMGKVNQLGTLEEVIELCLTDTKVFSPVVDFGHLNARSRGNFFPTVDDYRRIFSSIGEKLGDEKAKSLHCHFSKIEYTDKGEKKHLTFEDTFYGPEFDPLAEAIILENVSPVIICESDGTMAKDALEMKKIFNQTKEKYNV